MRIQNNVAAINSHRMYTINSGSLNKDVEKLSSGYRINRAGDDAAGLAISEKMRAQIRGLTMASKNSQDAISLIQTAEGALQSSHNILQRMRELAVQSASDTNETGIDRNALNLEFQQLIKEIDDIAQKTVFNDQKLIDGSFSKNVISAGVNGGSFASSITSVWVGKGMITEFERTKDYKVTVTTGKIQASVAGKNGNINTTTQTISLSVNGVNVILEPKLKTGDVTMTLQDTTMNGIWQLSYDATAGMFLATNQTNGKVMTARASSATNNSNYKIDFGSGIAMTIFGVPTIKNISDIAGLAGTFVISGARTAQATVYANFMTVGSETVRLYEGATNVAFQHSDISFQLSKAWITSSTANYTTSISVNRIENKDLTIQTGANQGDETKISIDKMDSTSLGVKFASVSGRLEASAAITQVNKAVNLISSQRAVLGALQNRLEFKISNLDTSTENLQAAESRIRDTDMAKQMTSFMKNNILFQASTAMLAQANSLPQGVLQLLG